MKKLVSLLLALALVLGLAACGDGGQTPSGSISGISPGTDPGTNPGTDNPPVDSEAERYGGSITISWVPGDTYDPMFTSGWGSYIWSMNVYENILSRDAEGNICPCVCDYTLSDDSLTLTVWVRDGVTFHNGDPVDIEDVKASYERAAVKVSRIKNHVQSYLESLEIIDNKLVFKFTSYDPLTLYYFTANQTWLVVLPKKICEKYGTSNAIIDAADAIGTGPYKVAAGSEPGVKMILERYDGYVAVPEGHTGMAAPKKAYLDSITVQGYADSSVAMMALLDGSLNFATNKPEWAGVFEGDEFEIYPDRDTNFFYLSFNTLNPNRMAKNANIRKAIAAAIDYDEFMSFVYPDNHNSDVSPMGKGVYYAEQYAAADYVGAANVGLAKQYLQAAGYNGEEIVCAIEAASGYAPIVQSRLEAAGINIKMDYIDGAALDEYIANHDNPWDIFIQTSAKSDYLPSSLAVNFMMSHWENARRDELLAIITANPYGSEDSVNAWKQLDALLTEELPSASVGSGGNTIVTNNLVWNCEGVWRYLWNSYLKVK